MGAVVLPDLGRLMVLTERIAVALERIAVALEQPPAEELKARPRAEETKKRGD